jgi:hypothetical protein
MRLPYHAGPRCDLVDRLVKQGIRVDYVRVVLVIGSCGVSASGVDMGDTEGGAVGG